MTGSTSVLLCLEWKTKEVGGELKRCQSFAGVVFELVAKSTDTHWREEEVSQEGQKKADKGDEVWRMKKSGFGRGAVKKGKQAMHKEGTVQITKQTKIH